MAFRRFNHLNVPEYWERYFTKYPQGMTILESLFEWVSQVDSMVDNQNKLNTNVEQFRKEIDEFVGRFDERLQTEVLNTLKDWQDSGFLDVVISDALQWQLDDYIATNEQDKLLLTTELQQNDVMKLNRGEAESITTGMLAPDIKEAITGGGWNFETNTSNLVDGSVTPEKMYDTIKSVNQFSSALELGGIANGILVDSQGLLRSKSFIKVTSNILYHITNNKNYSLRVSFYANETTFMSFVAGVTSFTAPTGATLIKVSTWENPVQNDLTTQIMMNIGTLPIDYVPFHLPKQKLKYIEDLPAVTPDKTTFFRKSRNLFDKTKAKKGYYVNQGSGAIVANPSHNATDFISVKPNTTYTSNQPFQRHAFYNKYKVFISGDVSAFNTITTPDLAAFLISSSDNYDIETLQIELGTENTEYESFGDRIQNNYLPDYNQDNQDNQIPSFVGDANKQYRMIGANIRTPEFAGDTFKLHIDTGHEAAGITSATLVDNGMELRLGMPFTADKVITMNVTPHLSMRQAGYEVATAGGLSVHGLWFYKNGVRVPAKDVVIPSGSFWYFGVFLV